MTDKIQLISQTGVVPSEPDLEQDDIVMDAQIGVLSVANSGALTATYFRDQFWGNRGIEAVVAPANGTMICMSGRNNIERLCGTLADNDYDDSLFQDTYRMDWTSTFGNGGDSGAPITLQSNSTQAVSNHTNRIFADQPSHPWFNHGVSYRPDFWPAILEGRSVATVSNIEEANADTFSARLYRDALQRSPSVGTMEYWSNEVDNHPSCTAGAQWVIDFFLTNGELESDIPLTSIANKQRRIHRLYWAAFNRAPAISHRNHWVGELGDENDWDDIVDWFVFGVNETIVAIEDMRGSQFGPC